MAERAFDLLIFDWDGTLADSEAVIVSAMQTAIAETGMEPRTAAAVRQKIGLGLYEALKQLYPAASEAGLQHLAEAYRDVYAAATVQPVPLFPAIRETLARLQARGYLLAIATGKSRRGLDRALAGNNLQKHFVASRCADETLSKPDPLMLYELLEELDISADAALMIGDSEYDMDMARRAGMAALGVISGVHDRERLLQCHALHCLESMDELPSWLAVGRHSSPTGTLTTFRQDSGTR